MYHWITDKNFRKDMKRSCSGIVNQLVQQVNRDNRMRVRFFPVGSSSRNLFIQNANEAVDCDYNLEIIENKYSDQGREIKEYIRKKFDIVLNKNDLDDCRDSTSVLTTGKIHFTSGNQTEFSIDICIVREDRRGGWHRLVHHKEAVSILDTYCWEKIRDSHHLNERARWLKNNGLWSVVRETYIDKKNMYLRRPFDKNHPSFVVYIESVNEIYNKEH